jgi:cathepsin F
MNKFALVVLLLVLPVVFSVTVEHEFKDWMKEYGKTYDTPEEYKHRLAIYARNLLRYEALNKHSEFVEHGPTQFSDLTNEEFKEKWLIKNFTSPLIRGEAVEVFTPTGTFFDDGYPSNYTWVSKGATTPIYNQGQCGSCWAFSTTESIESMNFLAGNTLTSLSMQQIVDCDTTDDGCNGGNPPTAYEYVIKAGGLETYADYPYTAKDGQCKFVKSKVAQTLASWKYVTRTRDEKTMQAFTYTDGPPSVCVDASTWDSYRGGVYTRADCGTQLDHCVQIVGWTVVKDLNAWIVRNSWGKSWGNEGYLYVAMGQDACGIAQECTSAQVTKA